MQTNTNNTSSKLKDHGVFPLFSLPRYVNCKEETFSIKKYE